MTNALHAAFRLSGSASVASFVISHYSDLSDFTGLISAAFTVR
jgi:hypothetical protein